MVLDYALLTPNAIRPAVSATHRPLASWGALAKPQIQGMDTAQTLRLVGARARPFSTKHFVKKNTHHICKFEEGVVLQSPLLDEMGLWKEN